MNMKEKSPLNRRETQTLLTTFKVTTVAGMLCLTVAGWGLLARFDLGTPPEAALPFDTKTVAAAQIAPATSPTATAAPPQSVARKTVTLNIVRWTSNTAGDPVAVVADRRGNLWYVMGSDVPRIEQGLQPQFQPQQVRTVTRSRAS